MLVSNIMISLIIPASAQKSLAEFVKQKRLSFGFTQEGLSKRSGVPLPTLRKFEQHAVISLESFLKLLMSLGSLDDFVEAMKVQPTQFSSIHEVERFASSVKPLRKRGWKT